MDEIFYRNYGPGGVLRFGTGIGECRSFRNQNNTPGAANSLRHLAAVKASSVEERILCADRRSVLREISHSAELRRFRDDATKMISCGGDIVFGMWQSFFEGDWNVPPHLNGEDHSRCQQECSHRDVSHRSDDHGKLRLHGVSAPGNACEKSRKAEAQLRDDQR